MEDRNIGVLMTGVVLAAVAIALGLYDIAIGVLYGKEATISCVMRTFCREHLILAIAVGVVIGHIFWR